MWEPLRRKTRTDDRSCDGMQGRMLRNVCKKMPRVQTTSRRTSRGKGVVRNVGGGRTVDGGVRRVLGSG